MLLRLSSPPTHFYWHGLDLYGSVERTGQIAIVFAVWAFQLTISPWWLKRFRSGPSNSCGDR